MKRPCRALVQGVAALGCGFLLLLAAVHQNSTGSQLAEQCYSDQCRETEERLRGPLDPTDPLLLSLIREQYLFPPSDLPYNLTSRFNEDFHSFRNKFPSWTFIDSVVADLYKGSDAGFFIEAGGLDGEYLSNTLRLEQERNWRGLLVEPDSRNFKLMRQKQRKSWTSPTCLSLHSYPHSAVIKEKNQNINNDLFNKGNSALKSDITEEFNGYETYESVQCLPPESLLATINVSHVDFFSLDTEGGEIEVLRNFPWNDVTVDLWVVEHVPWKKWEKLRGNTEFKSTKLSLTQMIKNKTVTENEINDTKKVLACVEDIDIISFMITKGYYYLDVFCYPITDLIFIRKASPLFQKLHVPEYALNRTSICKDKILHHPKDTIVAPKVEDFRDFHHYPNIVYKEL